MKSYEKMILNKQQKNKYWLIYKEWNFYVFIDIYIFRNIFKKLKIQLDY